MSCLLSQEVKITRVESAATAATTELVSDVLDMSGWDGVLFFASTGDVTSGSVITLTIKENTANSVSSPTPTAVTGGATTAYTAGASDADDKEFMVDIAKNALTKRYVFASLTRTTQNAVVNGIYAIQYRARSLPVSQPSSFIATATVGA